MYVCMHACMHVCMYVCTYACTYVYTYVYRYVCSRAGVCLSSIHTQIFLFVDHLVSSVVRTGFAGDDICTRLLAHMKYQRPSEPL